MNKTLRHILLKGREQFLNARNALWSTERIFETIYNRGGWGHPETVSGSGSTLENTKNITALIPFIIQENKITSMLDIPCGDFNWMKAVDLAGVRYYGADIVKGLIERNKKLYSHPNRTFFAADITIDKFPSVELILCRDCLVHLSYHNIIRALKNIYRSGAVYFLTTTFPDHENTNIVTGNWRPLDLQKEPFNFPEPAKIYSEGCWAEDGMLSDKALALWRIKDFPKEFCS